MMMNKLGWYALLIAMCGDLLFSLILSFGYKGYNNLTMSISALGNPNSPVRLPFNIWMIVASRFYLFLKYENPVYSSQVPFASKLTASESPEWNMRWRYWPRIKASFVCGQSSGFSASCSSVRLSR